MPQSFVSALQVIRDRSPRDLGYISNPFGGDDEAQHGLVRMRKLLRELGDPDRSVGVIHVAGSKGKGSTCAFAAAILTHAGHKTGRYTSPHLHSFRERFAIDGRDISPAEFARTAKLVEDAAKRLERRDPEAGIVTAFEFLTAMAFVYFAKAGVAYAVIEVGLGGRFDSTNVVDPLVSVITTLDFEHTAILGDTMAEIAANKAGIIKPGRPVISARQDPEAVDVIIDAADRAGSVVWLEGREWTWSGNRNAFTVQGPWGRLAGLHSPLAGDHQIENAGCAIAAIAAIDRRDPIASEPAIRAGIANPDWPGRYEIIAQAHLGKPDFVLDGAHTPRAAQALEAAFASDYPGRKASVVLAVLNDKNPLAIATALAPVAGEFIATQTSSPRSFTTERLAAEIAAAGTPVRTAPTIGAAIELVPADAIGLVAGSLTAVADARVYFGIGTPDPETA